MEKKKKRWTKDIGDGQSTASVEIFFWATDPMVSSVAQSHTRTAGVSPKYSLLIPKLFVFYILNRSYISSNRSSACGAGSAGLGEDFAFEV